MLVLVSSRMLIPIPYLGKTTFLFYLLLYRLEHELPTAVQLNGEYYFIFDKHGATIHPVKQEAVQQEDERLKECWALADSNAYVIQPCRVFSTKAGRIIQTTSPKLERWKEWKKQVRGTLVVADLPSVPEIAAIL